MDENVIDETGHNSESGETVADEFIDTVDNLDDLDENIDENIDESGVDSLSPLFPDMFFSQMTHSFVTVKLVHIEEEMEIPTDQFLLASGDFLPILDKLGSKAFAPVKMDLNGNIRKIRVKYETDADQFPTLQSIIRSEQKANTTNVANSATDAIMWLKRGLSFVHRFLQNVVEGETNLTSALQVNNVFIFFPSA